MYVKAEWFIPLVDKRVRTIGKTVWFSLTHVIPERLSNGRGLLVIKRFTNVRYYVLRRGMVRTPLRKKLAGSGPVQIEARTRFTRQLPPPPPPPLLLLLLLLRVSDVICRRHAPSLAHHLSPMPPLLPLPFTTTVPADFWRFQPACSDAKPSFNGPGDREMPFYATDVVSYATLAATAAAGGSLLDALKTRLTSNRTSTQQSTGK